MSATIVGERLGGLARALADRLRRGPAASIATLSLALNLLLTGVFLWMAMRLLQPAAAPASSAAPRAAG